MKIIVDAYNVLHQIIKNDYITDQQKEQFINQVALYAKQKTHTIVLVFDGGPFLFPTSSQQAHIVVSYSGPKDSADDMILRYIKEHKGHSMILASSDRQLCQAARFYGVEAIEAKDFCDLVCKDAIVGVKPVNTPAIKMNGASPLVDALMKLQTEVPTKVEDMQDPGNKRASNAMMLSKKERKRMHKIKKL